MLSIQQIKFNSNDDQDYIRRLERAYEQLQEENKRLIMEIVKTDPMPIEGEVVKSSEVWGSGTSVLMFE